MTELISARAGVVRTRAMWISGVILGVVLALQLGLPEREARAVGSFGDVAGSGEYTILTLPANNEDLLVVLDGRSESLVVYRIRNKSMFERLTGGDLKALFANGRRIGAGVK